MARPLRIELSGGLYHVTTRDDRREGIYFNDIDRLAWLDTLSQVRERFIKRSQKKLTAEATLDNLSEVPRIQRRPVAKPLSHYRNRSPDSHQAMALAYQSGDYSMSAIADFFGVHYSTVSRAVKEYEKHR